jgi:hypothetical protein
VARWTSLVDFRRDRRDALPLAALTKQLLIESVDPLVKHRRFLTQLF